MIVGYTMLHYGSDYLAYALESLRPYVSKHIILYSPTPTFGHGTDLPCPDSRDELYAVAKTILGNKLEWYEGLPQNYHVVFSLHAKTQMILEVDADEVWPPSLVAKVLEAYRNPAISGVYRMPMVHHWRSFGYICRDSSWPVRVAIRRNPSDAFAFPDAARILNWPYGGSPIHHFGYARAIPDMQYKIATSAHKGEWRDGWFDQVFMQFPQRLTDLHPVSVGLWNAEEFDRANLPAVLRGHPWYDAEVIE